MPAAVKKLGDHASTVFSGLTLAAVLWVGNSIAELQTSVAVHEYRIQVLELHNESD